VVVGAGEAGGGEAGGGGEVVVVVVVGLLENHDVEPFAFSVKDPSHPVPEEVVPEEVVPEELPNGFKVPISNPPRIRLLLFFLFLFGIIIL
jgi:hypothetical protein